MSVEQEFKIDLDRGVSKRIVPSSRITVCMYKDDPGIYYDISGKVVTDKIARFAGFDVKGESRRRKKMKRLDEAKKAIDDEFLTAENNEVIYKKGPYIVIRRTGNMAEIMDDEGNKISSSLVTVKEAKILVDSMTDEAEEPNKKTETGGNDESEKAGKS